MTMYAIIVGTERDRLIVFDFDTRQRVIVNTPIARQFRTGNIVRIQYNGVMTASIPPQISAFNITKVPWLAPWCNWC